MAFLPARMTRLLIGGHQSHMPAAIETLHREGAVHIEDYDGDGHTSIGTPLPAGEAASANLVRARGLLKAIGAETVRPGLPESDVAHTLSSAEKALTPILDAAGRLRADVNSIEAEQTALAPYRGLDIDLGATTGLTSVKVWVGQARTDPRPALAAANLAHEADVVASPNGLAVAVVVATADAAAAERVLASAGFTAAALPQGRMGTPAARLAALDAERSRLASAIAASTADLVRMRDEWGPRLAAAESALAAEVEKTQAPLRFGVTQTTFHVEGWVPAGSANRVKNALSARFGDALYFEDLGDAPRTSHAAGAHATGPVGTHAPAHGEPGAKAKPDHATGTADPHAGLRTATGDAHADGHDDHHGPGPEDEAPVHLENKGAARPYEFLLSLLGKPRYNEVDPTKLMLVFFPLFFGLMVGDLVVGLIIAGVGVWLKTHKVFGIGGPAVGRVLMMGGLAAAVVGLFIFGEALGIHFVTPEPHDIDEPKEVSWEEILGIHFPDHGLLHKTGTDVEALHAVADTGTADPHATDPHATDAGDEHATDGHGGGLAGLLAPHSDTHLKLGPIPLGIYSKVHDIQALLVWSILIGVVHLNLGFVLGVRNVNQAHGITLAVQEKLAWITLQLGAVYAVVGSLQHWPLAIPLGVAIVVGSVALLWMGAQKVLGAGFIAVLEVFGLFGNLLSYTRLAAIGASKAGMVIAFTSIGFSTIGGGDVHSGAGWAVFLAGMALVIVLAILSGALQSLRLQFVEFFGKFFQGGGRPYVPFGRRAA